MRTAMPTRPIARSATVDPRPPPPVSPWRASAAGETRSSRFKASSWLRSSDHVVDEGGARRSLGPESDGFLEQEQDLLEPVAVVDVQGHVGLARDDEVADLLVE